MANYAILKAAVENAVKTNGIGAITGATLQATLLGTIESLTAGYQFMGVATPLTEPGTPDQRVFYIGAANTYNNFGTSVTVPVGKIVIFRYASGWSADQIDILSTGSVTAEKLAAGAVVASKIADGAVELDKLDNEVYNKTNIQLTWTTSGGSITSDISSTEIYEAPEAGINVVAFLDEQYTLMMCKATNNACEFIGLIDSKVVRFRLSGIAVAKIEGDIEPVSVSQNPSTGNIDIKIGDVITPVENAIKGIAIHYSASLGYSNYSILKFDAKQGDKLTIKNNGVDINILYTATDDTIGILYRVNNGATRVFTMPKDIKALGAYAFAAGDINYDVYRTNLVDGIAFAANAISAQRSRDAYSDLNDIPINTVTAFTSFNGVSNAPSTNRPATVLTYCIQDYQIPKANTVQICMECDANNARMFYRVAYRVPLMWRDWVEVAQKSVIDSILNPISQIFASKTMYVANAALGYTKYDIIPFVATTGETITWINRGVRVNLLAVKSDDTQVILKGGVGSGFSSKVLEYDIKALGAYALVAGNIDFLFPSQYERSLLEKENKPFASVSMFNRLGVIGDSYASGWLDGTGTPTDFYSISWPQQLARLNGITAINFTKGGLTTRTWLTNNKGLTLLNSEDACDVYLLVLGINDASSLGMDYLGSIEDIHDGNPALNADTFYGNYGRIVEAIKSKSANAKICFVTMSFVGETFDAFNSAIQNIASHYSVPCIIQRDDEFFTSPLYENHKISGHPSLPLYGGMAKAIERLLVKNIEDDILYWNNMIPT